MSEKLRIFAFSISTDFNRSISPITAQVIAFLPRDDSESASKNTFIIIFKHPKCSNKKISENFFARELVTLASYKLVIVVVRACGKWKWIEPP